MTDGAPSPPTRGSVFFYPVSLSKNALQLDVMEIAGFAALGGGVRFTAIKTSMLALSNLKRGARTLE